MSEDTKPKIILNVPNNLKPEDLVQIMPTAESVTGYEFLGHEVNFFSNAWFSGIEIKWGAKGMGWGSVTLSHCHNPYEYSDNEGNKGSHGTKGKWECDTETMSPEFVSALLRHVADDLAKKFDNPELMNQTPKEKE